VKTLTVAMQKPVFSEGVPIRAIPIVAMKSVHRVVTIRKGISKPQKGLALPLNGITTVNKTSAKEETSKS
jgi:hypothetical protein